jgi:hypothetical protein
VSAAAAAATAAAQQPSARHWCVKRQSVPCHPLSTPITHRA